MIKKLLLIFVLFVFTKSLIGQSSSDTSNYPYWMDMMQDKSINLNQTKRAFDLYWQNRTIEKGSGWKAFKRWEWMAEKTVDSIGNFPDVIDQLNQLNQMIKDDEKRFRLKTLGLGPGSVSCKTRGDWKEFGPVFLPNNNTGQMNGMGRLNAVAIHPTDSNTIFAGACAGGIWKTTDGGKTWAVYTDSLPTLGVSSIVFDPYSPSTMYMGTGDRDAGDAAGFGVFKSTNGGASWFQSNTGMGNRTVGKLIINPSNTSVLLAATNNGIYRSTNAGSNWTQIITGNFKDIVFKPNNSDIVYATRDGILFRSLNNGLTWVSITNGLPTTAMSRGVIDVNVNMPNLVYFWLANGSVNRGFYLSRDSGTTFVTKSTTPNLHDWSTNGSGTGGQAWYDKDMVTDPVNPAIIYVGGVNIFRSNDTGQTWTIAGYWVNKIHADQHELISCPLTNRIFAANDGGLYYTRDRGVNWIPVKSGLAIAQIYKLDCSRTQKDILINGYQDNGTANFYNNDWYTTRGGDGMDCEIDQIDNRYSYGELYYGSIFRIYDVTTQATIAGNGVNGINEQGGWVTPFILKEGSGTTMYIGYKNIWRSNNIRNNPPTWTRISNNLGGTNASNFTEVESCIANPDILYASRSNGTFYRSDDVNAATPTWNVVTQPVAGTITAIETDPKIQNVVYIGIGNRVYRSMNKGTNWVQIATNLSHNVNCILLDTSSKKKGIYVGTNGGGIWYTDTTTNVWRYYSHGLPHSVRVTDIELYYDNNPICKTHVLYASTYNRGNWFGPVLNEGNELPIAKILPYDTTICLQAIVKIKSDACNVPGRFKWEFSGGTYQFVNGSDTFSKDVNVSFGQRGEYKFKFMAENCVGIDTIEGFVRVGDTVVTPICRPITSSNADSRLGIFSVEMNGMKNQTAGRLPEGAYVDFACNKVIQVKRGKKYALKVLTGATFTEQVKTFIDYNNNGDFTDAGELVFQPAPAVQTHVDSILIPMSAKINTILRMRVRSDYLTLGTNPCSNLNYGQTEDYGIIVVDSIFPDFMANKNDICLNDEVVFSDSTESMGWQYAWSFGDGAIPSTANTSGPHSVKYSTPGYKTVSLIIDGFEKIIDSFVLIHQLPQLTISSLVNDTSLCINESFKLEANDINNVVKNNQWYLNQVIITDSINATISRQNVNMTDSGLYTIIASSDFCADTASQFITIHAKPNVDFNINQANQCLTNNSFLYSNLSNVSNSTLSYSWFYGDNTSSTSVSPTKAYSNFGNYNVKLMALSNHNCSDSISKSINVYENAITDFDILEDSMCFNENAFEFINQTSLSNGVMDYNWFFGDGNTTTDETPSVKKYLVYNAQYQVKLIVNTNQNCKDSITKTIYLNPSPAADFAISDDEQCLSGNLFSFSNTSNVLSGNLNANWHFGNDSISNLVSPNHTYINHGNYDVQLIAISDKLCRDTLIKTVKLFPMPLVDFSINDTNQCLNQNQFLYTNSSILVSGSMSFNWLFGDGTTATSTDAQHRYLIENNAIEVKLIATTDELCQDSLSKFVVVNPSVNVDFNINNPNQCLKGNVFDFDEIGNISNGTYTNAWNFGDGNSQTGDLVSHSYLNFSNYNVRLISTSNQNCRDTMTKAVQVYFSPVAQFNINDTDQCLLNNSFDMTDVSNGGTGYVRQWTLMPATNLSMAQTVNRVFTSDGTYKVKLNIATPNLCRDSVEKTLLVVPSPEFSIDGPIKYCINEPIVLNAVSTDNSLSYNWRFTNTPIFNGNPYINNTPKLGSFNLDVTATNSYGCVATLNLPNRVNVYALPVPQMDTNVISSNDGIEVIFNDITPIVITSRTWSTSPIVANGTAQQLIMNLTDSVKLNVLLSVVDTNNCVGVASKSYFFTIPNKYFFPTSFSPNGDGFNDAFTISGYNKVSQFELKVYNRWGELVFETNNPILGWDGKSKGEFVQQGDYLYMIKIIDLNKKVVYKKGMVTVLR
ncbi:MAG: PKD domain-containing protein [Bacteroidota bacterium]|nr:PKD domain-containing protein [Bacteroidota bacterium]